MVMVMTMMMMTMTIKQFKIFEKELIDKNILDIDDDDNKKFDNIINKWKETKDKKIVYINTKDKVAIKKFDINEILINISIKILAMKK